MHEGYNISYGMKNLSDIYSARLKFEGKKLKNIMVLEKIIND